MSSATQITSPATNTSSWLWPSQRTDKQGDMDLASKSPSNESTRVTHSRLQQLRDGATVGSAIGTIGSFLFQYGQMIDYQPLSFAGLGTTYAGGLCIYGVVARSLISKGYEWCTRRGKQQADVEEEGGFVASPHAASSGLGQST